MKINSVLIANRGEIAIRVIRAVAELEAESVAIFAADDGDSAHVKAADRAFALAGSGPTAYLDIVAIVSAAREAGCDALHPGYGFLSENPALAEACSEAGLIFIGPDPSMLLTLGDKAAARRLARELGVPVLTGTETATTIDEARAFLREQGAGGEVMLKALAGGGGRGIRLVSDEDEVAAAFEACASEAKRSFGNADLYVERYLRSARHIEVQVLGDGQQTIHLGERDCTLQRRHQKLVEFAPAPNLAEKTRDAICNDAVRMAAHVGYRGVGTFEFLVDADRGNEYWFMEANPRIQVEHTVTEEVTGVDLVQAQLRIAAGETLRELGLTQERAASPRGRAVQLRLNMERLQPSGAVVPSGGTLTRYDMPSGPGVRIDGCGYVGYRTTPSYDSLLTKLIVSVRAADGDAHSRLISKALRALGDCRIEGVDTNLAFLRALLEHPAVAANAVNTRFIEEHGPKLQARTAQLQADLPAPATEPSAAAPEAIVPPGNVAVTAPMFGVLAEVMVAEGDILRAGQPVARIEAMKMEHLVFASAGGTVTRMLAGPGTQLNEGSAILFVDPQEATDEQAAQPVAWPIDAIPPLLVELNSRKRLLEDEHRADAVARRRKSGQRTARENLGAVCDPGSFVEYGGLALAAQRRRRSTEELIRMSPADGLIAGVGSVNADRFAGAVTRCAMLAYDYTVFAGTQGHVNHKKMDRLFDVAAKDNLPLIVFAEGGGGRPGDVDADMVGGLIISSFTALARRSGMAPSVAVVSGRCFAGNAAVAGLCDLIIATRDATIGMGGPAMIEGGGLGSVKPEEVGPVDTLTANGVIDVLVEDEEEGARVARQYLGYFQGSVDEWTAADQRTLRHIVPENRKRAFDVHEIIHALCDKDSVIELRPTYGRGMITALARIEGRPVGLIANSSVHLSGAIDSDGADKAARLIELCNSFDLPVVSLCDTPGFMVGPESEKTAAVRRFSRLFVKGAALQSPLMTVVLRRAYGMGAQAMAGGDFHAPRLAVSWPTGEFGGMGIEGGVRLGFRRELDAIADPIEREAHFNKMVSQAYEHGKSLNAAAHFEIDDVIDPAETRALISATLQGHVPKAWGSVTHHYVDPR